MWNEEYLHNHETSAGLHCESLFSTHMSTAPEKLIFFQFLAIHHVIQGSKHCISL